MTEHTEDHVGIPHLPHTVALEQTDLLAAEDLLPETRGAQPVSKKFIWLYALAYVGLMIQGATPVIVTLAVRVDDLVPKDQRSGSLGIVVGAGALVAMVAFPLFGRLSDRTRSRYGMRRPWMAVGAIGALLAAFVMAAAPNLPLFALGYALYTFMAASVSAALNAVLPDHVPIQQRGTVSGIIGIATPVGLVGGAAIAAAFSDNTVLMFTVPALAAVITVGIFGWWLTDRHLDPSVELPRQDLRETLATFYVNPRKHPDFGYAWLGRFLFGLATSFITTYLVFYLQDRHGLNKDDATKQIAVAIGLLSFVSIGSSVLGGRLSDRFQRRKIFVLIAAVIWGGSTLIVAATTSLSLFLIAMAISGIGLGAYLAVDLALVTDVLPDPETAAKDMGVFHMASTLPQTLAPLFAALILLLTSDSYPVLYAVAALCGITSAFVVFRIKAVR